MAGISDPYSLLGVPRGATSKQIKAAYRKLAKRYHPDSPTADAQRFLRLQEAYQLLADPLRRREWDARHSPAPVRADQPAPSAPRPARAGSGRRRRPMAEPPPDAPSRSYTWSASEVPWWEEGGESRRARRPRSGTSAGGADGWASTGEPAGAQTAAGPARPDFDVYSRSSGAAWSSAARAYFRRVDQDLPRRGSFHHQGAQPLTAARARVAAEENARRAAATGNATQTGRAAPGEQARRPARTVPGSGPAAARSRPAAAPARPLSVPRPEPDPVAGVARDAEEITAVRAVARERAAAARWPSLSQRVRVAALAWLPLALLLAYAAPVAAGCADTASACPPLVPLAQGAVTTAALALLVVLPRLAYIGAVASAGVIVSGGTALLGAWLLGVRPPQAASLPGWAILGGVLILLAAYLVAGTWLLTERSRLPWVGPRLPRQ